MKKGKFYLGPVGIGKTKTLKAEFEAFEGKGKRWMKAREVSLAAQRQGLVGIDNIASSALHLFIDDLGHEAQIVSHFSTVFSPIAELIQAWYDNCMEWPKWEQTIHFTSNLSPEELRKLYGDFIFDRLIEMCEWVQGDGESHRK